MRGGVGGGTQERERRLGVLILALAQRADLGVERAEALLVLARLLLLLALGLRVVLLRVELRLQCRQLVGRGGHFHLFGRHLVLVVRAQLLEPRLVGLQRDGDMGVRCEGVAGWDVGA